MYLQKAPHPFDRMEKLLQAFKDSQAGSASSEEKPAPPAEEKLTPAQVTLFFCDCFFCMFFFLTFAQLGFKAKQFYDKALKLLEVEKYTEAESLLSSSYTLRKKIYEPHNIDLINTTLQLAHARQNLGNKESALKLYEEAIGQQRKKLGSDSLVRSESVLRVLLC